uniref:Uncharacterized protein n=1 Tax=Parascaris equorum TaxID=6256 RepID=A0A914RMF1_PAREQ
MEKSKLTMSTLHAFNGVNGTWEREAHSDSKADKRKLSQTSHRPVIKYESV